MMIPLFESIVNGWWQGIVLTLIVWLALRDARRISAATKVAVWQTTLLIVILLPAIQRIPLSIAAFEDAAPASVPPASLAPAAPIPNQPAAPRTMVELREEAWAPIVALCVLVAAVQLLRLAFGYLAVRRLKRKSTSLDVPLPASIGRPVALLASDRIAMPMAVGYREPAIILPRAMTLQLTDGDTRHILLHESAHLLRRDDWMALSERLVRAVFFWQPAVHWICRQIEREREIACDDWVVAQSGEAKPYAEALAHLAALGSQGYVPMLATGAGRPKQIFERLEKLLDRTRNRVPQVSGTMVLAVALALLFLVSQGAAFSRLLGFERYSSSWVEHDNDHRRALKLRGEMRLTANDRDVETISPGGKLLIERRDGWRARTVELEADENGKIVRRYFVDGIARPWGVDAQRYLATSLQSWSREQGWKIPERTAGLLQEHGVSGSIEEIRTIRSSGTRREYLEELINQAQMSDAQMRGTLRAARDLGSDEDKRRFLERVGARYAERGMDLDAMDLVDSIQSHEDRHRLLERALDRPLSGVRMARFARSVRLLHSDAMKAELLARAAAENPGPMPAAFDEAVASIHSEKERERLRLTPAHP